jgi:rhodanese-related sulfurtransferase
MTRALATTALLLGLAAPFAGSPYSSPPLRADDQISALTLASWIRDQRADLIVFDLRSAADFNEFQIPTAENMAGDALNQVPLAAGVTVVVYADSTESAIDGWRRLRARGFLALILYGGANAWLDDVMSPVESTELTRYFGGVARTSPAVTEGDRGLSATERARLLRRRGC